MGTVRWWSVAAAVSWLAGCAAEDPRRAEWSFRFLPPGLETRAVAIEARILEGGCGGSRELYVDEVTVGGGAASAEMPPVLGPGRYGLAGRARDAVCLRFAEGCEDVTLPRA